MDTVAILVDGGFYRCPLSQDVEDFLTPAVEWAGFFYCEHSRHQLVDLRARARGKVDADQLLLTADDPPDVRLIRDRFEYSAIGVQYGRAAFLRLCVRDFHPRYLLCSG